MNPKSGKKLRSLKPKRYSNEHMLRCCGAGKDNIELLMQRTIAATKRPMAEDAALRMLAAAGGVEVLDKAIRGVVGEPANGDAEDPTNNRTLKLLCASFADKAITYKMPHPELNIPGVPDEEEQATPRQQIKKTTCEMRADSGKKRP
jgi:hypothetical protein